MSNLFKKKALDFIHTTQQAKYFQESVPNLLSQNCIFHCIAGKLGTYNDTMSHSVNFFHAFPDFTTKLLNVEQYGPVVICEVEFMGTHLNHFVENQSTTNYTTKSDFGEKFAALHPTGKRVVQHAEQILIFENDNIAKCLIKEDTFTMYKQLGLTLQKTEPSLYHKENLQSIQQLINQSLPSPLSAREMECLAFMLSGFNAKSTAARLFISPRTVETHILHTYQKLNCTSKQDCIDYFYELGLLTAWREYINMRNV